MQPESTVWGIRHIKQIKSFLMFAREVKLLCHFSPFFSMVGVELKLSLCFSPLSFHVPHPTSPPGQFGEGWSGGKLSEQHICVNCQCHFPSVEHIWGLLFGPGTPFLTLYHPPPSKFPVSCHFSFSCALSSTGAPPPHTHQAGPPSLSIPLSPAVTHSCSTGGGGEPEPGWEQEKKNEMRERKEKSVGGLVFMRMPTASSAVRGDPAGL